MQESKKSAIFQKDFFYLLPVTKVELLSSPTRTLAQAVNEDFFDTHRLLRKLYVPNFKEEEFSKDDINKVFKWLQAMEKDESFASLPDFVRSHFLTTQQSLKLWDEISLIENRASVLKPVAYLPDTEDWVKDVRFLTLPLRDKLMRHPWEFRGECHSEWIDALSSRLYFEYWRQLKKRGANLSFFP